MRDEVGSASGKLVLTGLVVEVTRVVGKIELLAGRLALVSEVRSVRIEDKDGVIYGTVEAATALGASAIVDCLDIRETIVEG